MNDYLCNNENIIFSSGHSNGTYAENYCFQKLSVAITWWSSRKKAEVIDSKIQTIYRIEGSFYCCRWRLTYKKSIVYIRQKYHTFTDSVTLNFRYICRLITDFAIHNDNNWPLILRKRATQNDFLRWRCTSCLALSLRKYKLN